MKAIFKDFMFKDDIEICVKNETNDYNENVKIMSFVAKQYQDEELSESAEIRLTKK